MSFCELKRNVPFLTAGQGFDQGVGFFGGIHDARYKSMG
jgi:hypothetical protein